VLGHHLIELALFQQLSHGADRKAEGRHGGAQAEGLLHGAGCTHFVVAQADAEATGFTATTVTATAFTTTALAGATVSALTLAMIAAEAFVRAGLEIAVGHGRTPE
jgi:hypothetical protein